MEKEYKKKKQEKTKAEEAAINRILCWVAGGLVLEFLLVLLNRYWFYYTVAEIDMRVALGTAVKILAVAGFACAVGAFFWWRNVRKSGGSGALSGTLCLFMLGVSASCFAAWFSEESGIPLMMYVVVPAVIVLAVIHELYQREFFVTACQSALTLLGIWLSGKGANGGHKAIIIAYVVLAGALVILSAVLCRKAQGAQGILEYKGKPLRLLSKEANYGFLYGGALVSLVTLIVAAIGLSAMILYAVTVAWLLIMAVYYTVKLM